MQEEEKFDVESRNLMLKSNQMIYIPKNAGLSQIVVD
jgi:hypothetical protein